MGMTFENLTLEELCDLMCGGPEKEQEGRHRAVAAMLLGIDRIPVLVVPKKRR